MRISLVLMVLVGCTLHQDSPQTRSDEKIRFYQKKISTHPRLYPAYAQLGAAYLEKAQETRDPQLLRKAREALAKSISMQSNFLAFKTYAELGNFSHRFEESLSWAQRAAAAYPESTAVTVLQIEALLGLGRDSQAESLLLPLDAPPADFHIAAARGRWFASQKRIEEAVTAFLQAADFARTEGVSELDLWAQVMAAGVLLDNCRPAEAATHLNAASRLDPHQRLLRMHRAELLELRGEKAQALALNEELLREQSDPFLHAVAFAQAQALQQSERAGYHFLAAESGYQRVIDAGEVYTLGALARLYLAAQVHPDQARELAEKNLKYKRDAQARDSLAAARR